MLAATAVAAAPKFIFDYGANLWKTDGAITAEQIQRLLDRQIKQLLGQPGPDTFLVSNERFKQHYIKLANSIYNNKLEDHIYGFYVDDARLHGVLHGD